MFLKFFIILSILCAISAQLQLIESNIQEKVRSFKIDYANNRFLKDDEPFRFISGSFHYFRAHPESWQRKLRTMRAAGLNAVTTYVEWSLHNPKENQYIWEGIADLERFVRLAEEEDLYVILRPGPYICAERDMGGFPYWLLRKFPQIQLRTADINYLSEVRIWYNELMNRMDRFLYGNGGPIIMVQVENEYGSFYACDKKYREWLRDETHSYVKDKAVLFTNDGPSVLKCGHIDGVLATLDFGATDSLNSYWALLRTIQPKGPYVNAEYYPGWLTHWQEDMQRVSTDSIIDTFEAMLNDGASVNFYMFFGGTNFGFTAGANDGGPGKYNADVTSYDYDAPMDEAGDPTEKYFKLREIIGKYLPLPNITVPRPLPKKKYGRVQLTQCCSLLSNEGRRYLSTDMIQSIKPLTFEALDQNSGLVLYETMLPELQFDPTVLKITEIRDRAYVYIDRQLIGILSRESEATELPIMAGAAAGSKLQILIENQGRINYNIPNDFKGILSDVMLGKEILINWNITKYPLESFFDIQNLIEKHSFSVANRPFRVVNNKELMRNGPTLYYGNFEILNNSRIADTYLDPTGWGKGVVFINGFNLGRYWPVVGPQITLYVPRELLKIGKNQIVLIEYQKASRTTDVTLTDRPDLDGVL